MINSNNHQYKQQNISAKDQPRILIPQEIPEGHMQLESGLLIKNVPAVGNIATRSAEKIDQFGEIKEILHNQKQEIMSGYNKYIEDLGLEMPSEKDFDKTIAFSIKKWEADGSLKYLQNWLKSGRKSEERKVYMSASPNQVIPKNSLKEMAERFQLINSHFPKDGRRKWEFIFQYSEEEICGDSSKDENGNKLPVQLMVWTNKCNLVDALPSTQRERIKEKQRFYGSVSDQTVPQTFGHW